MTKYLKGSKRLAIIQRWLQGIDDPNYDVLPTKKEGKYIVKKKEQTQPVKQSIQTEDEPEPEQKLEEPEPEQKLEEPEPEQQQEEPEPEQPHPVKPIRRPTRQPSRAPIQHNRIGPQYVDSTVNLEILEQLKLLGDEIRTKRERKEQKQLIKQVVQKQLRTQPNEPRVVAKSKPVEEYEYYSDEEEPIIFKSRIFH